MFISGAEHFERNHQDAKSYKAGQARMTRPDGSHLQGVVIWSGKSIRAVMPVPDALRLANQIADAIAAHRTEP